MAKKVCKFCGKIFETNIISAKYCSAKCKEQANMGVCQICGKPTLNHRTTCSPECLAAARSKNNAFKKEDVKQKIKATNLRKYGVENPQQSPDIKEKTLKTVQERYGRNCAIDPEKSKQTMLERYGVEHALQAEEFVEKMNATIEERGGLSYRFHTPEWDNIMLERYGTTVPYKNDDVKRRGIQTLLDNYGVTSPAKLDWVKEKCKTTCLQKYGVEYSFQSEEVKTKAKETMLRKYGVESSLSLIRKSSKINKIIGELLDVDDYEFTIGTKQYDLKKGNTLIEVNPTVSHNSDHDFCFGIREPDYHLEKTKLARENGFQCFHIWEWDVLDKVKDIFSVKQPIAARKCDVILVGKESSDNFLAAYHLQGKCEGDVVRVGLCYDDNLVGIMTFGAPRYSSKAQVELLRLCFSPKYRIIGGSAKMFQFFTQTFHPESIISYCDNSKFSGHVYSTLGFVLEDYGTPTAHWHRMKDNIHVTDALLRQRGADALIKTNYGKGTCNADIMLKEGFVRVYDCGQSRYIWYRKENEAQFHLKK